MRPAIVAGADIHGDAPPVTAASGFRAGALAVYRPRLTAEAALCPPPGIECVPGDRRASKNDALSEQLRNTPNAKIRTATPSLLAAPGIAEDFWANHIRSPKDGY